MMDLKIKHRSMAFNFEHSPESEKIKFTFESSEVSVKQAMLDFSLRKCVYLFWQLAKFVFNCFYGK